MLAAFANLPRPVQILSLLGVTGGATSVGMAAAGPKEYRGFFLVVVIGIVVVALLIGLYILILKLKDKAKSGPFASLIAKAGSRGGAADPAQKARMDDLRKKFEEGVNTFKSAGKDLYSLPWFLLVGPSGSGKTEAMRHCNVGFPPGLQDCLQGTGGTMNMHWWFTNNAVVLDTAGRMFMEGADDGGGGEWKEFMKLLKDCRPNAPINGLLLVISAESLLKESSEKIEKTAGAIARQLDVVQRTLDVRFPVFIVVTKCDKIVGFRDFFETLNDPQLQHQMLGWSNPAPLDEAFKPDQVDKHLETVRQRLMKRRAGLLQNPVHTTDPNGRRADEVDEMFELPDNLVRIAPRLRRYLEMIFVAGEWSPKPLFLRGIYFTSSMREGQALDMTLASALGIEVESIPGGKEWDKDKAYFLRDVFLGKVFKEKGLVTRAVNVNKAIAKQRRLMVGGSLGAVLVLAIVAIFGWFSFKDSLGPPSTFWQKVRDAYAGGESGEGSPMDIALVKASQDGKTWVFRGDKDFEKHDVLGDEMATPTDLVAESARWAKRKVNPPLIAAPIVGWNSSWSDQQLKAHRAIVERAAIVPVVQAARSKLSEEKQWGPDAVAALAQLIRIETFSFGSKPSGGVDPKASKAAGNAIDADALFRYVLDDKRAYDAAKDKIKDAVDLAYQTGWSKDNPPSEALGGKDEASRRIVDRAVQKLVEHLVALGASPGSDMDNLNKLLAGLKTFRDEEANLLGLQYFKGGGQGTSPQTMADYGQFESAFIEHTDKIAASRADIDAVVKAAGPSAGDPVALLAKAEASLQKELSDYFAMLKGQLPEPPLTPDIKPTGPAELTELRTKLDDASTVVTSAVRTKLEDVRSQVRGMAPLMAGGHAEHDARAYVSRAEVFKVAAGEVKAAAAKVEQTELPVGELPPTLASQIDATDKANADAKKEIGAWAAWAPDSGQAPELLKDLGKARDDAVAAAIKAADLAQGRKLNALAQRALSEKDVLSWPRKPENVAKRVADLAAAKLGSGAYQHLPRPPVPLSELQSGGEFLPDYHVEAAREVLNDWAKLRGLIEPASTGQRLVIGRDTLRAEGGYRDCADATGAYVRQYIKYWRDQALEASKPSKQTWDEFSAVLMVKFDHDFEDSLDKLSETVKNALAAVPAGPAWGDTVAGELADANAKTRDAFSGLAEPAYRKQTQATRAAWKELSSMPPARARATLLEAIKQEDTRNRYFSVYKADSSGYWNGFVIDGLLTLIRATEPDLLGSKSSLISEGKGVPLVIGNDKMRDISPDAMRKIKEWSDKLDPMANADKAANPADTLPPELRDLVRRLAGRDMFPDQQKDWFRKLKAVLRVMAGDKPLQIQVSCPQVDDPGPTGTEDVRFGYKYAALRVGGLFRGDAFNLTIAVDPQRQKDIHVDVPLADGQTTEICLYVNIPDAGKLDKYDARILLPGPWSLVRKITCDSEHAKRDEKTGEWRVLTLTEDGKRYLWVNLKFDQDLPLVSDWPHADQWPNP
jgi:hypothetical protein